ncbi:hypothetical protein [Plantactinospora sp. GCM10030261]|uniref:hypothetical protein n=1 Tax=Plantactinospora sp. GCM10030261 TaxID=3273420 RepID=UPI0036225AE8
MRRLAALSGRAAAQRAEARDWYEGQIAAAERAVDAAEREVAAASARVTAAREVAERVEADAGRMWQALPARLNIPPARLGAPPVPVADATATDDPEDLLDDVRTLLERAGRPGDLPASANPLLMVYGVLGAALAAGLGAAARMVGTRYGGDLRVGLPVIGLVLTLLGPVVGLAPARRLADRRHATLGPRAMAVVVAAGLVTTALLVAVLR